MQFFDTIALGQAVEVTGTREMRNGALVMQARAARGGNVQDYLGVEVGKPEMPVVRVYRDADEVFHKDSLKTFAHKAVTLGHPSQPVTSRTWKDVARGHTGDEVLRDGEFVKIPMLVADQAAIDAVRGGTRELSMGYQCDLRFEAGTSPSGEPYDAKQVHIVIDHVAIVPKGRAGPDCRIGDGAPADDGKTMRALPLDPPPHPQQHKDALPMKTLMIDGHSVALDDAAFIAVSSLNKQLGTLTADNLKLTADLAKADETYVGLVAKKDAELADAKKATETKDGEIVALKKQLADAELTPAKLDTAVASRVKVIGDARRIAGDKLVVDGKTEAQIRREAVAVHLGDAAKDLSDEAVNGAFLSYASKAPTVDQLGRSIADSIPQPRVQNGNVVQIGDAASEYAAMRERDANAWKKEA